MRKILLSLIALGLLWIPLGCQAQFKSGVHYIDLPFGESVSSGKRVEVREFFWYGCPHCYTFEPILNRWLGKKPAAVDFVRSPAFLTATERHAQNPQQLSDIRRFYLHARAYYAFEKLGVTHKLHRAFFESLHMHKQPLNNLPQLMAFVKRHGINPSKFKSAMNSFSVDSQINYSRQLEMTYQIPGVPILVVDGRYMTSPKRAGGPDKAIEVVNYLVKKVLRERRQAR